MAVTAKKNYSLNLGIPEFPDSNAVPPELYDAALSAYVSLHNLAAAVDQLSGTAIGDQFDVSETDDKRRSCIFDRLSAIYIEAGEPLEYGALVEIRSDGKAYNSVPRFTVGGFPGLPTLGAFRQNSQFMCSVAAKEAGDTVAVFYKGLLGLSGAAAQLYYNILLTDSQYSGRITTTFPNIQVGLSGGQGAVEGIVGIGLGNDTVSFEGARL
jgi:hypothetical protein